ncbi:MAG: hypothetical protein KC619_19195 [Myxococcales bacterium]|nr:hypothetical protein [Myxococcales bacterium]
MQTPTVEQLDRGFPGGKVGRARRWTPAEVVRAGTDIHRFAAWAVAAHASSQWGKYGGWWAHRCVGRPEVWPGHGDKTGAWAPGNKGTPVEWIELRFDPAPPAAAVRVFETNGAGGVYAVAIDAGEGWEVVWLERPRDLSKTACMLEVALPEPRPVHRVRVWVDGSRQDSWVEIDTVSLRCVAAVVPVTAPVATERGGTTEALVGRARRFDPRQMAKADPLASSRGLWPIAARASTEYSARWGAGCLVGRPQVWPTYGDRPGAWAPLRSNGPELEHIEVDFAATDVPIRAIRVFETSLAGSTVRVSVIDDTGTEQVVFTAPAVTPRLRTAQVLEIELEALTFVRQVRCWVERAAGGWVEIDSVSILPVPRGGDPYRGGRGGPELVHQALEERLMGGFDGTAVGEGERYGVFAMFAHDWQVGWRGSWPVSASASSSFGSGWTAASATGKPGIYPLFGDLPGNWAPAAAQSFVEWLDVDYGAPIEAVGVRVFETFHPGAVFAITVYGEDEAPPTLIWADAPFEGSGADVLEVRFPRRAVRRVRAYLDNAITPGWCEIDTIGLLRAE